ncbi:MAG: hypothetical protein GY757_01775 [bacterium]|nr:hypothetical protein [bacterium]
MEIAKKLKLLGFTLPVNDSMIMCHAKLNKLTVLSLNRHFELTGREIGFQYEILKNF